MRRVTEILRDTGRHWEAWAWAFTSQRAFPRARWPGEIVAELGPTLDASVPVTVAASDLSRTIDLSEIELPSPGVGRQSDSSGDVAVVDLGDAIRFDDEAEQRGIGFVYFNGDEDESKPGARMFEPNGGAVAVLDFDRDGMPDLFFSQGSLWPEGSHVPVRSPEYVNRCFRNTGTKFADVTQRAGLADEGYGQGRPSAISTTTGSPICTSPTSEGTNCIATTATARFPMSPARRDCNILSGRQAASSPI